MWKALPPMRRLMNTNAASIRIVGARRISSVPHATSFRYVTGESGRNKYKYRHYMRSTDCVDILFVGGWVISHN